MKIPIVSITRKHTAQLSLLFFFLFICEVNVFSQYSKSRHQLFYELDHTRNSHQEFYLQYSLCLNYYYYTGASDSVLKICEKMLSLSKKLNNDTFLERTYFLYGTYFSGIGAHDLALGYINDALKISKKINYRDGISAAYKEMGYIYRDLEEIENALEYLNKSREFLSERQDGYNDIQPNRVYYNLAETYLKLDFKDPSKHFRDSAKKYALDADIVTSETSDPYGYARVHNVLGLFYQDEDTTEAYHQFKKAIVLCDMLGLSYPEVNLCINMSKLFSKLRNFDSAEYYAKKSLCISLKTNNLNKVAQSSELLKTIFENENINQYKDSILQYTYMCDSISKLIAKKRNQDALASIKYRQKWEEMKDEEHNIAIEKQKREQIQYVFISLTVITALIIFFVLSRTIIVNAKFINYIGNVCFLIFFEFINLILHSFVTNEISEDPLILLFFLVTFASMITPAHHFATNILTKKMMRKNDAIRLKNAEKTIVEIKLKSHQ